MQDRAIKNTESETIEKKGNGLRKFKEVFGRMKKNKLAMFGLAIIVLRI